MTQPFPISAHAQMIRQRRNQKLAGIAQATPTKKPKAKVVRVVPTATLSATARERLLAEACESLSSAGMSRADVLAWFDERMAAYLKDQPWWFGQLKSADKKAAKSLRRHQIDDGQIEAGEQPLNLRRTPSVQYEPNAASGPVE